MERVPAAMVWVTLVVLGMVLGPPNRPDLNAFLWAVLSGDFRGAPAWLVAEFQWMGLWPLAIALLIRGDWRARVPAWPFLLGSFVLGCYALLPWFIFRSGPRVGGTGWLTGWWWPAILGVVALLWLVWAAATGSPRELLALIPTEGFTWSMTLDFLAFWLLSIVETRARARRAPWWLCTVPLLGLSIVLVIEALPE